MSGSAVIALTVALAGAGPLPVQVEGDSRCPTAAEVAAVLPEMLPAVVASRPDVARVDSVGSDLRIELRAVDGTALFSRRLTSHGSCSDLAVIAAVVIASWSVERSSTLSAPEPTGVADAGPPTPPGPSGAAPSISTPGRPAPPERTRALELALGLGDSITTIGSAGAGRLELALHGPRFGLRAGLAAQLARDETVASGTVSWRRYALSIGPELALARQPVTLDVRAELFAGLTSIAGRGFDVNRRSSAVTPGLALALRLSATSGWVRPWIEAGGQFWSASQQITIATTLPPSQTVTLPRVEARLFAGASVMLFR